MVGALMYATTHDVPGVYNVAGDGKLPWSEVCAILGKRRVALPPVLTAWAAEPLRILRPVGSPARGADAAALRPRDRQHPLQARRLPVPVHERGHGRGVRAGAAAGAARSATRSPTYRYERDVETFFRHSPAVVRPEQ